MRARRAVALISRASAAHTHGRRRCERQQRADPVLLPNARRPRAAAGLRAARALLSGRASGSSVCVWLTPARRPIAIGRPARRRRHTHARTHTSRSQAKPSRSAAPLRARPAARARARARVSLESTPSLGAPTNKAPPAKPATGCIWRLDFIRVTSHQRHISLSLGAPADTQQTCAPELCVWPQVCCMRMCMWVSAVPMCLCAYVCVCGQFKALAITGAAPGC